MTKPCRHHWLCGDTVNDFRPGGTLDRTRTPATCKLCGKSTVIVMEADNRWQLVRGRSKTPRQIDEDNDRLQRAVEIAEGRP